MLENLEGLAMVIARATAVKNMEIANLKEELAAAKAIVNPIVNCSNYLENLNSELNKLSQKLELANQEIFVLNNKLKASQEKVKTLECDITGLIFNCNDKKEMNNQLANRNHELQNEVFLLTCKLKKFEEENIDSYRGLIVVNRELRESIMIIKDKINDVLNETKSEEM